MKKIVILLISLVFTQFTYAQNTFTEKDREIMRLQFDNMNQRLIDMEKRSDDRFSEMQKQMDIRFDSMQKQIDTRFDETNKSIERLYQLILGILATFTALCGIMFGLMIWDRRTTLKPFEEKIKTIDKQVEELAENKTTLKKMLTALQQQAQKDTQLAEILKSVNLW
jgi:DNA anti-recombination protein RmuC